MADYANLGSSNRDSGIVANVVAETSEVLVKCVSPVK